MLIRRACLPLSLLASAACAGSAVAPSRAAPGPTTSSAASDTAPPRLPAEPVPKGPLPRDAHPTRERLALTVDPEAERFGGTATIDVTLDRPRDVLWLHGRGLSVTSCELALPGGEQVAATWSEVDPSGVARVSLAHAVSGNATLTLVYDAPYDASLVGVYRASAGARAGAHAVFSKFEAIYARRAFPCWDEPSFKVPFDVTLTVPAGAVALGNMPIASTAAAASGAQVVTFATTPPLPTYLVAFAVGPFASVAASVPPSTAPARSGALPLNVIALRGREQTAAFAAAESPALVANEEAYYGVPFPYPKLDMLAVPDFQSGAMENAGLITFRDSALLVDPKTATLGQRIGVDGTVAHEVAHQWFGDLVTMAWWDDLWLNESFASFVASRTMRAVKPELEVELGAVADANDVMQTDGLASARRIRQPITSTDDITNAFDGITYQKGEAVLAMVERYVGEDAFRAGLHDYLVAHAGGNATTADLVAALSRASEQDLAPLFASFLDQPGVPLVTAHATCEGGKARLVLSQERWLPVGSPAQPGIAWTVPVCARVGGGEGGPVRTACTLLAPGGGSIDLGGCPDWVMPNADARGYFRFALDGDGLARLQMRGLPHLTAAERLSLAGDVEALFQSATLPARFALAAMDPLARDAHGAVATAPLDLYASVADDVLAGDAAAAAKLRAHVRSLYAPAAASLGWRAAPGEPPSRALERARILRFLARRMDDPKVLAEGARLGRAYLGLGGDGALHPEAVDPDLASTALLSAMRIGDAKTFDLLERDLFATDDAPRRRAFLTALSSTRDPALATRALDLALDARLRKNERLVPVGALLDDPATRDLAWTWLVAHFDALAAELPDRYPGYVPSMVRFCDRRRADEVNAFFAPRAPSLTGATRNLALAVEAMKSCAALADAQRASATEAARTW
jgi:alanyl aminopeptidase